MHIFRIIILRFSASMVARKDDKNWSLLSRAVAPLIAAHYLLPPIPFKVKCHLYFHLLITNIPFSSR